MPSFEILLPLGAIAFYLYDSALLLHGNELVLVCRGGHWLIRGGSDLRVAGKRLYLPNPLTPQALLFRVAWSTSDRRSQHDSAVAIEAFRASLQFLRVLVIAQIVILMVLLPGLSWTLGSGGPLLGVIALFYALVLLALLVIYRRRESLGLTLKGYWLLALDVLACAPFAANIVRKLSLQRSIRGNPLHFARANFDALSRGSLLQLLELRLREELAGEQSGTARHGELQGFLDQLPAMLT
ncbi:MAG TPA: hypothetical protein VK130_03180 [Steroidobacteraceae bacterium]|nr:hypothetical protein [Steroidobacteraceae bacterium]